MQFDGLGRSPVRAEGNCPSESCPALPPNYVRGVVVQKADTGWPVVIALHARAVAVIPVTAEVDEDGLVHIDGDDVSLVR